MPRSDVSGGMAGGLTMGQYVRIRKSFNGMKTPIETRKGKRAFIRALTTNIRNQVLLAVPRMPAEWTGHELRAYLADVTEKERTSLMRKGKRKRDYWNTVITDNL